MAKAMSNKMTKDDDYLDESAGVTAQISSLYFVYTINKTLVIKTLIINLNSVETTPARIAVNLRNSIASLFSRFFHCERKN